MPVAESVVAAAVAITRASRTGKPECPQEIGKNITWGAGPRASQYLVLAAKAYAVLEQQANTTVEDIRRAAYPVLRHRLVRSFHAEVENVGANDIIKALLERVTL